MSRRSYVALLLVVCLQALGLLTGNDTLRGIGMASAASPLPRVFTSRDGLEGFSSRHVLLARDRTGQAQRIELTPALYARLAGPYNRRNAFGAVVAYGPQLHHNPRTRAAFEAVARHALCGDAPLLRELGVPAAHHHGPHSLLQMPRPGTLTALPLRIEVACP